MRSATPHIPLAAESEHIANTASRITVAPAGSSGPQLASLQRCGPGMAADRRHDEGLREPRRPGWMAIELEEMAVNERRS